MGEENQTTAEEVNGNMHITQDRLRWLNLNLGGVPEKDVNRQRRTVRAIIRRLYGEKPAPGVILADEVGMGKTYVSLAVAAALFKHFGCSEKIIVLAPSGQMKETWKQRWDILRRKHSKIQLPSGQAISELSEATSGISFGSYEEMKHTSSSEVRAAFEQAIIGKDRPRGRTRRRLRRELFLTQGLNKIPEKTNLKKLARGKLNKFWRDNYDSTQGTWNNPSRAYRSLQRLIFHSRRPRTSLADLVIFDEAHRMAGQQRQVFFYEVLSARAKRTLFVTATPFSLSVEELLDRVGELYAAAGWKNENEIKRLREALREFHNIVKSRDELPNTLKELIEKTLGKYLVRNVWPDSWDNKIRRRAPHELEVPVEYLLSGEQIFAMLALERKFVKMLSEAKKTYITSHRETLCSSFKAIEVSNDKHGYFNDVVALLPINMEAPKLEYSLSELARMTYRGGAEPEKVVVFCSRNATIQVLRKRLEELFAREEKKARRRWDNIRKSLRRRSWSGDWPKARLSACLFPEFAVSEPETFILKLEEKLQQAPVEEDYWNETWGPRRHVDWVSTITGERSETDRLNEHVQFAFNLPGPPYILLCSEKGRESIDLHRWCRKIVHYDLDWNPSVMEQRVGRIDRINSLAARTKQPIEIYYFRIRGTYEERIFRVVKERMEMTRILLGAGEWLSQDDEPREVFGRDLEKYRLNFAP
jgi:hypothetical protein